MRSVPHHLPAEARLQDEGVAQLREILTVRNRIGMVVFPPQ